MKLIIIFILYLSLAESIFVDRECVGNEDVLDCSMMDGNNFYAASRSTEFGRVKFTRLTGQLDLTNLPQVRLVEVRYGEPECSQLYSYHGLVVLNGEHSSVFCQIDELTTESTPTTNPTTNAQTLETGEEQSSPSEKMTLSTAESSFSTSMGENTDGFENKDFTSTDIKSILIPSIITTVIIIIIISFCVRCFCHRCQGIRKQTDVEMGTLRTYRFHDANDEEIHFDVTGMKND